MGIDPAPSSAHTPTTFRTIGCWLFDVGCWMFVLCSLSAFRVPRPVLRSLGACCPNAGARLCEPQQCRIFQEMGKFLRFLQVLSYCGPQARAPFDLGNTPLGEGGS